MRERMIKADVIDTVLGLGPNLFYNSPMEACVVICRSKKPKNRKGKILFIDAINEVTRERAQSFLTAEHIEHIASRYLNFEPEAGYSTIATIDEIAAQDFKLSIPLYVKKEASEKGPDLDTALADWRKSSKELRLSAQELFALLDSQVSK